MIGLPFLRDREDPGFMTTDYVLDRLVRRMATHGLTMYDVLCSSILLVHIPYVHSTWLDRWFIYHHLEWLPIKSHWAGGGFPKLVWGEDRDH